MENPVATEEVIKILKIRGYEVSPQAWEVAMRFVGIIDFSRFKFNNEASFLRHVCHRLGIEVDRDTLNELVKIFKHKECYKLYPDAIDAVRIVKEDLDLKIAIITTIPKFKFMNLIEALLPYLDLVMTGSEAGCDKSNPKMYLSALRILKVTPKETVVVGDEEYVDVILPKKIGMRVIQIIKEHVKKRELADAYVRSLIDAVKIIREWINKSHE